MAEVLVLLGSESDMPIANKVKEELDKLGISNEVKVASAHRTPDLVDKLVKESDAKVFIGIAGLSAALPGVIASKTKKPVIGVPVNAKLGGLDALLSIAQMPPGVPVAAVGIDNGKNAAVLAARILALLDKNLEKKI
ncbi:MAG: 5-(carboxyamino)imidazole ribonucleotide mutase [Candidatus Micrarchaeota archaeon]|nr:5-(carboxyamino)imidazole ribonucleotide mutase [Candidatus Micrarchaeota archaeon]